MSIDWMGFLLAAIALGLIWGGLIRLGERPNLWIGAWLALMLSTVLILLQPFAPWLVVAEHLVGPWFPALLLAGALQYAGLRIPPALWPATVGMGITRAVLVAVEAHTWRYPLSWTFDELAYGAAIFVLWQARPKARPTVHRALPLGILGIAILNTVNYAQDVGVGQTTPIWSAWLMVGLLAFLSQVVAIVDDLAMHRRLRVHLEVDRAKHESLTAVAAGVAHSFNNLFTGIVGNAEVARGAATAAGRDDSLEKVRIEALRGAETTRSLQSYAGGLPLRIETLDPSALLERLRPELERLTAGAAKLVVQIERDLPPIEGDARVLGEQVAALVRNAAEASPPDGVVFVSARTMLAAKAVEGEVGASVGAGRLVCIGVRDEGPGIPDEVRERMFDPYFSTRFLGRGLGLALVAGAAREQNQALRFETANGGGTSAHLLMKAACG